MSVYAIIAALLGGGSYAGFNATAIIDTRYMTHEAHVIADAKSDIKVLRREIRKLNHKVEVGIATEWEKWELERLKEDLLAAEDELK